MGNSIHSKLKSRDVLKCDDLNKIVELYRILFR